MARPRRTVQIISNKGDKGNSSSSNGSATSSPAKNKAVIFTYWKEAVGFICLVIAATVGYQGYLETRVNTPYDDKKVRSLFLIVSTIDYNCLVLFTGCYT